MSIQSEISRIQGNVSAALGAIESRGVTVAEGSNSDDLAELITAIGTKLTITPTDLTPGVSPLTDGEVVLVYE